MQQTSSFSGRARRRRTSRAVEWGDRLARALITVGGIGTIVAVSTVCLFLVWVVVPLFAPGRLAAENSLSFSSPAAPLHLAIDEEQVLGWSLDAAGELHTFPLESQEQFPPQTLTEQGRLTASSFPIGSETVALGLADGTVQLVRISFVTQFVDRGPNTGLKELHQMAQSAAKEQGVLMPGGDRHRLQKVVVESHEPIDLDPESQAAIEKLDHLTRGNTTLYCGLTADDKLWLVSLGKRRNPRTLEDQVVRKEAQLPLPAELLRDERPSHVLLAGSGDNVYVLWPNGRLLRFETRNLSNVALAEELNVLEDPAAKITAAGFMLGRGTVITGDSTGRLRAWFRARPAEGEPGGTASNRGGNAAGGERLVCGHDFDPVGSAIVSLAPSTRTRLLAAGLADGRVKLVQVTSERRLGEARAAEGEPVTALALSPKDNGLTALTPSHRVRFSIDAPHAEVTLASLFLPVWYEGYSQPSHVWQSSAANQDFEPKLGLWPLVFGTIKATFYSMLFGAPLALLAAIYTSEFLHPRIKSKIKPTIELMASLPSVVLGFLAALLFAPIIAKVVPVVLVAFVSVPAVFLLGAYCWQLVPQRIGLMLSRWRFVFIVLTLPLGLLAAWAMGPIVERLLFQGDIMGWLDGQHGSGAAGWMILFLPLCGVGSFFVGREVNTWLRRAAANWSRTVCALVDLLKFFVGLVGAVAVAGLLSWLMTSLGWDPRGSFLGTYDQRNALIVGFVMGFAIIPLIYTVAEDALSTVPEHLRSASLGAGATPWQTAVRIVIPTAMSGLFSALMIGLGRAVGETMIVLMAAGNTPVRQWNIFNGFRTLSANIAVELPEAPVDSTHYRTLFLAALCLFVLTFAVNTVAELVRLRFRRRAYEL
jgi:phosphate transport system permease protein